LKLATTFLRLGRVSNLPTVWSNTLAASALVGSLTLDSRLVLLLIAMSLAYVGGMFLNDAFDQRIDAVERPERPIPSGAISASTVYVLGFTMLLAAVLLVVVCANSANSGGWVAVISAIALMGCIILYNAWHKNNPLSPLIMGGCRMLVYITAGLALTASPEINLFAAAAILLCYLIGLTYTAKQENFGEMKNLWPLLFLFIPIVYGVFLSSNKPNVWLPTILLTIVVLAAIWLIKRRQPNDIPRAVVTMIAGISLIDAVFIAAFADLSLAFFAIAAFGLTLLLQKFIAGT